MNVIGLISEKLKDNFYIYIFTCIYYGNVFDITYI